jgi:hypothetical protein
MPPAPPPSAPRDAAALSAFLAATPALCAPLAALAALAPPDAPPDAWPEAWIAAGFVRNAAWDALHGWPAGTNPPADLDVVWFDPSRATAAADAALEASIRAALPGLPWSVRNQSRMAARNGDAPYAGTLDAMRRRPDTATAVAARLDAQGSVEIAAPWGVDDLLAGIVRPTPAFAADPAKRAILARRIAGKAWLRRWPALRILHDPPAPPR